MRRFTATNAFTATTVLAGTTSAFAAAIGRPQAQGIALGAALAFGALLLRCIARDFNRAGQRHAKSIHAVSEQIDTVSDRLDRTKRKLDRRIEILDARVLRESTKLTLRILADINAARIEQMDAAKVSTDHDG
jgi:hypothetical protein